MTNLFIDPNARVTIEDEAGTSRVLVRAKMDYGTVARFQNEAMRVQIEGTNDDGDPMMVVGIQLQELLLLIHNVVYWEGVRFRRPSVNENGDPVLNDDDDPVMERIPCSRQWIERLDPDDPFVKKIVRKIDELNTPKTAVAKEGDTIVDPLPVSD